MPIENRNLQTGTVLKARHKGKDYACEVVKTDDGLRYRLKNGKEFNSPSSAGREVTGGGSVNGWRFWSLDGDLNPRKAKIEPNAKTQKKPPAKRAAPKAGKKNAKKKVARAATKGDAYGCGACGETFPTMKAATKHALTHTTA